MQIARTLGSLTLGLLLSAAAIGVASAAPAKLVIPKPTVPTGQAYSPHAVVAKLAQARFKVLELYRKGQAYAIVAIGPTGNKVQMTVDGASGTIVGMAILRRAHAATRPAAPHRPPAGHAPPAHTPPAHTPPPTHTAANPPRPPAARPAAGHIPPPPHRPATRFADDSKPFGAVIPLAAFRHWTAYKEADWRKPAAPTIPVAYTYAPYREALPSVYYVALPNQDAFAVAPPNYMPYDVYDPYGTALNNALNDADDAEYRAALAEADANYEAARANLAEADNATLAADNADLAAENAALRDQMDIIQNAPPPPVEELPTDASIAPDPGENLDDIPDVPPPSDDLDGPGGGASGPEADATDDGAPTGDDTVAPTNDGGGDDTAAVAPSGDNGGDDNAVAPDNSGDNGGDNTVAPDNSGDNGDNTVAPDNSGGDDNNAVAPDNNGDNGGGDTVAPDNAGGDDNSSVAPDNGGGDDNAGDNNADDNSGADNSDNGGDSGGDTGGDDNSGDGQ